jgi:hypothetical protein
MIIRKATMTVVRNKTGLGLGESPYTDQVDYLKPPLLTQNSSPSGGTFESSEARTLSVVVPNLSPLPTYFLEKQIHIVITV